MVKLIGKNILKRLSIVVLLIICVIMISNNQKIFASSETTNLASGLCNGAEMINGVDYSGQGIIIDYPISTEKETYVSGDYVYVPVYKGSYVQKGTWGTRTGWSESNNRENPDFTQYNGTDTATEYEIKSKVE